MTVTHANSFQTPCIVKKILTVSFCAIFVAEAFSYSVFQGHIRRPYEGVCFLSDLYLTGCRIQILLHAIFLSNCAQWTVNRKNTGFI